ncbi:replicative helicase loader/inhibitor [Eubacteriaceae bacterium ES2]|nr:replicative helicase loader/inhibitor [Eubacteriaceae bacterium ES2]
MTETNDFLLEIQGCFPRITVRDTTIQTWQEILEKVDYETCHQAYIKYLKSGESREPKPGDILTLTRSIRKPAKVYKAECDICNGRGFIFIVDQLGHESVARCNCDNSKNYPAFPAIKIDFWNKNKIGQVQIL